MLLDEERQELREVVLQLGVALADVRRAVRGLRLDHQREVLELLEDVARGTTSNLYLDCRRCENSDWKCVSTFLFEVEETSECSFYSSDI